VVITPAGAAAGAYRIGYTGSWTAFPVTGSSASFTLPAGTPAYSVAFTCGAGVQVVLNYTASDRTVVGANCDAFSGVAPAVVVPDTPINGTYDASALGAAGGSATSGSADGGQVDVTGASGSYSGLNVQPGPQAFAFTAYDGSGNILGFKTLHNVAVSGTPLEVDFPAFTAADATQNEPITASGLIAGESQLDVQYLPGGGPFGIEVTNADEASYAGVPAADFAAGDNYAASFETIVSTDTNAYLAGLFTRPTSTGPIDVTVPTLSQIPVSPTDLSFPLTYTGLSASDAVRGLLEAEYVEQAGGGELDIATPAYLAGRASYAPPSFAGVPGFITITPANVALVEVGLLGFTYQPGDTLDYIDLIPPPGQTLEVYLSLYAPSAGGGQATIAGLHTALRGHAITRRSLLNLRLMQKH
jgi:hypothetical protein